MNILAAWYNDKSVCSGLEWINIYFIKDNVLIYILNNCMFVYDRVRRLWIYNCQIFRIEMYEWKQKMRKVRDMNEDVNWFISEINKKKTRIILTKKYVVLCLHFLLFFFLLLLTLFDVRRKKMKEEDRHISIQTRPPRQNRQREKKSTTCRLFFSLSPSTHSRP